MHRKREILEIIILALLIILLLSCNKYRINKHYSKHLPNPTTKTIISGTASFDDSCVYELEYEQINKLVGLSNGSDHHQESIRIGWVYNSDRFDLYAYYYIDGKHSQKDGNYICSVFAMETFNWEVQLKDNYYLVRVNDYVWTKEVDIELKKIRYILFPYFGGEEEFPNKENCLIKLDI
jgi:hypothetical protein